MSSLGIFNKETKTYQKVAGTAEAAVLDAEMSDTSENPVQNKVIKKYVDDKQVEVPIAGADKAGIVKPADGLIVAEDGTLKVKLDRTTLTMDQVNNVIKLADTLKEKINGALPAAKVVNNLTTTEAGFALDARQANPNVDGTLAKQINDLNGSLNNIKKGGWLEHGKAISFNIYDNTSYFLFLNSAGNVYASVLSTLYDFHNTIIKNDFNNDIEISYDGNTKAVTVKNNGSLLIDCRCI